MKTLATAVVVTLAWVVVLSLAGYVYLRYGHVPVSVNDPAFPYEAQIVHVPLGARIDREMPGASPVPVNEATLTEGARVYKQQCAFCHGVPNHPSALSASMYPGVGCGTATTLACRTVRWASRTGR